MENHEMYMQRCIALAQIARSRNNTPVGSLVVIGGEIVGEGIESVPAGNSATGHAEILACQAAVEVTGRKRLNDATLYTTAEPCFMCSYVIRQCGIALVVYGVETPEVGGITSAYPILIDKTLSKWRPAVRVVGGVLKDACQHLSGLSEQASRGFQE